MKIGIIGGFGPESTAKFYMSIVNKNMISGNAHPDILIHNVPVPFELEEAAAKRDNVDGFLPLLLDSVRLLKDRCDVLAMPCNTLHVFIDDIRRASQKPILSILEETSKEVERSGFSKVGILATTKTSNSGILESKLGNVLVLKPSPDSQSRLSEIIHCILQCRCSSEMKTELVDMVNELKQRGAEAIILGCTDLQLMIKQSDTDVPLIDTMDVLANSVLRHIGD